MLQEQTTIGELILTIIVVCFLTYLTSENIKLLTLFWHIGVFNERIERLDEILIRQWKTIHTNGLYDMLDIIFVGIVGCDIISMNKGIILPLIIKDKKVVIINTIHSVKTPYEDYTLHFLYHFCQTQHTLNKDVIVIYIHSRGVSYDPGKISSTQRKSGCTDDWTIAMEYFILIQWKKNMEYIKQYHTLGCEMWGTPAFLMGPNWGLMYVGNFWWTHRDYVLSLPDPHIFCHYGSNRFGAEIWILLNFLKTIPKHLILYHISGRNATLCKPQHDIFHISLPPEKYKHLNDCAYYHEVLPQYLH